MEWKRTKLAEALEITPGLGNFLSGMETRPVAREGAAGAGLGNFLSGMETLSQGWPRREAPSLGNFLSGMETRKKIENHGLRMTLETSLVEWKHILRISRPCSTTPWKLP